MKTGFSGPGRKRKEMAVDVLSLPSGTLYSADYALRVLNTGHVYLYVLQMMCREILKGGSTSRHRHEFLELAYVAKGRVLLKTYKGISRLTEGTIVAIAPKELHSFKALQPSRLYLLSYGITIKTKILPKTDKYVENLLFIKSRIGKSDSDLSPWFSNLLFQRRLEKSGRSQKFKEKTVHLFKTISGILRNGVDLEETSELNTGPAETTSVLRVIHNMKKNIHRPRLRILDMCDKYVHMSPRHFRRIFKQVSGFPPRDFLIHLMIEHAKSLLKKGMPAKSVAQKLGYQDVFSFYKAFRKETGTTVNEFLSSACPRLKSDRDN